MDALGIAPSSSALQADADLFQLNVQNGEAERTRTVIVFIDNEVHTPFCHGLEEIADSRLWNAEVFFQSKIGLGGSTGLEPATASFTVRCSAN